MNRAERRAAAKGAAAKRSLPRAPQATATPSYEVCDGICRSCSRRTQLFLPGRVCGRCITTAIDEVQQMTPEMIDRLIEALGEEEEV